MIYFRIALRTTHSSSWQWKSTKLTSLNALFSLIRTYKGIPQDQILVFFSSSPEIMNEMLDRENNGLASNSATVKQLLHNQKRINAQEVRRLESELAHSESELKRVRTAVAEQPVAAVTEQPTHPVKTQGQELLRERLETGEGGDHDQPYTFTLPIYTPQALSWVKLLAKVRSGELEP